MILLILTGYAGAGKSTVALQYAKKHDYGMINQDHFLFKMNPASLTGKKMPTKHHYEMAKKTLLQCVELYMKNDLNILLEGALVPIHKEDSININDFIGLAHKYGYSPILITIEADNKTRHRRQLKRRHVLKPATDKQLINARKSQKYSIENYRLDTSKLNIKQTLLEIEKIVNENQTSDKKPN